MQSTMLDLSLDRKEPSVREQPCWNVDAFVDSLKTIVPDLNWRSVIEALDDVGCMFQNFAGLQLLLRLFRKASKVSQGKRYEMFT